jgi:DNA-directed RNA polymerase specialized sigma24 family protein
MMARFEVQELVPWRQRFVNMLPLIVSYVARAFRLLRPEERDEAVQEAVAGAFTAYAGLVERGKENLAFPSVLARFSAAQVRAGRRVAGKLNIQDVSSVHCQRSKRIRLGRLDRFDPVEGCWKEAIVEDLRTPVADQACFRIDLPAWLKTLPRRDRKIAEALSEGRSTTEVARRFGLTLGRVSQLRREFKRSWFAFHGEEEAESERMELLAAA